MGKYVKKKAEQNASERMTMSRRVRTLERDLGRSLRVSEVRAVRTIECGELNAKGRDVAVARYNRMTQEIRERKGRA